MEEIKLHGSWPSPFSCRIIWALKLKGIPFEYIDEDLANKSPQILLYNPVHKKIPVLVHGGVPICESMVILEYIDQKWPLPRPLFLTDPYERAVARFWIKFVEDKGPSIWMMVYRTDGEEQENAKKEAKEMLKTLEEHVLKAKGDSKFFGGENINIVDIVFGWIAYWVGIIEEVTGIDLIGDGKSFPLLSAWIHNFKNAEVIMDNTPDREKMLGFFVERRSMVLAAH